MHPFLLILDKHALADTLGIKLSKLTYLANVLKDSSKYNTFNIKKRDGGSREIMAPIGPLKNIQRRIAARLELLYTPKVCAHGYIKDRSVLTNAKHHKKKRWVFKVDLQNFFPSIHFGRVHGLLQAKPFNFPPDVALLISQLCTSNGCLPQGAPTSPLLSNFICTMLDRELSCLAQKYRCHYSRYADDLVFSTNLNEFPIELGYIEVIGEEKFYRVGKEFQKIITQSGFVVNEGKVTLCGRNNRQCVTGIVVNDKLNVKREYVRQVRSILHSWKINGLQLTAQYYYENIDKKNRPSGNTNIDFANVVRGKVQYIGMVKGWNDPTYSKLASVLCG